MNTQPNIAEADGTLEREGGKDVIRFRRHLDHPVERVWAALTEPKEMIRWWGEGTVELIVGGEFTVRWLNADDEGNRAEMTARITTLEPPRLLETDGSIHGRLRWELRPDDGGTELTFTSTLELPEEFRAKVPAGWHWHLDALAVALGGGEPDLINVDGWEAIHERYAAKLS